MDEKKKGIVSVVIPKYTPIYINKEVDYFADVPVEINSISDDFIPKFAGNGQYFLYANIIEDVVMTCNSILEVDCGVELNIPLSYKYTISTPTELAIQGILVNAGQAVKISVIVTNLSRQSIIIKPKQSVALIAVEPFFKVRSIYG